MTESDSIIMNIPEGYKIESLPKSMNILNEFGSYLTTTLKKENEIIYSRKSILLKGDYNKSKFNDYVTYNNVMYNADRNKIVFVKI